MRSARSSTQDQRGVESRKASRAALREPGQLTDQEEADQNYTDQQAAYARQSAILLDMQKQYQDAARDLAAHGATELAESFRSRPGTSRPKSRR